MTCIKLAAILCAALVLQSCSTAAAVPSKSPEPQAETAARLLNKVIPGRPLDKVERLPTRLIERFISPVNNFPGPMRPAARALLSASDDQTKERLIEMLGDAALVPAQQLFLRMLDSERKASIRLQLLQYLNRYPKPEFAPVFEGLARHDPDPAVAVEALEGLRAIKVLELRGILTRRLRRSRTGSERWQTFAEADERWISLVRGTMLPAFLNEPPPLFTVTEQDAVRVVAFGCFGTGTSDQKQVASAIMTHHRQSPFDFGITAGDNFYPTGMESVSDPRWQTW